MCWIRVSSAIALGFALVGCRPADRGPRFLGAGASTPRRGGTLRIGSPADIRSVDPAIGYDSVSSIALHLLNARLVNYDAEARIVPELAESFSVSEDGRTYRFRLRPGVRFHNGRTLVAEDFRYSIERLLAPETASAGADFFRNIVGAEAMQKGRAVHAEGIRVRGTADLEIELNEPDVTFLYVLAMPFGAPVPREVVERWGRRFTEHPVGTGPFRFVSWERGQRMVLERNPDYFVPDRPYLDRVVVLTSIARETLFLMFENQEVDHLDRFTAPDYLYLRSNAAWRPYLVEVPGNEFYGSLMNTAIAPFDDVRVRRAFNHALNKQVMQRLRNGRLIPAKGILPPRMPGFNSDLRGYEYDPERARALLREAGYPRGFEVDYLTLGGDESSRMWAEAIQNDLARIGVRMKIRFVSFPAYLSAAGRNQVAFGYTGWSQDYPDPRTFLETKFHSRNITPENANNDTNYRNAEVDRLLDRARVERDQERRLSLYRQAEERIVRDAPWTFEFHTIVSELVQPWVRGYRIHPVWSRDVRDVWLDLPLRERARVEGTTGLLEATLAAPLGPWWVRP